MDIIRPDSGAIRLFGETGLVARAQPRGYMPEERGSIGR